jgi:hypothetical protein
MIPQDKTEAVTRALRHAFGVTAFDDIQPLTRGLSSALVFRIVVQGSPYLLKIITRTDAMSDPTHQFGCMQAAAEADLAPPVWYAGIDDRISITGYIDAAPFSETEAFVRLPRFLRTLHALPPFPAPKDGSGIDRFIRRFQASDILPKSEVEEVFAH